LGGSLIPVKGVRMIARLLNCSKMFLEADQRQFAQSGI